jgi:hypothetical protein
VKQTRRRRRERCRSKKKTKKENAKINCLWHPQHQEKVEVAVTAGEEEERKKAPIRRFCHPQQLHAPPVAVARGTTCGHCSWCPWLHRNVPSKFQDFLEAVFVISKV